MYKYISNNEKSELSKLKKKKKNNYNIRSSNKGI